MFSTIVKELGGVIGLPDLAPDLSGALTLNIDGHAFLMQYFEEGEEIYIIHRLGTLPEERDARLAAQRFLLEGNCFFRGVGSGTLGTEGEAVFYTARLSCRELSGRELEHVLRAVTDVCAKLRAGFAEVNSESGIPAFLTSSALPADAEKSFSGMLRV